MRFFLVYFVLCAGGLCQANEKLLYVSREAHPVLSTKIKKWISQLQDKHKAKKAKKLLESIGENADFQLFEAYNNSKIKLHIIKIVGTSLSERRIAWLLQKLKNKKEQPQILEQIVKTLGLYPSPRVLKALGYVSQSSKYPQKVRYTCAQVLCSISSRQAIPYQIKLLLHSNPIIVKKSRAALNQVKINQQSQTPEQWQEWWEEQKKLCKEFGQ